MNYNTLLFVLLLLVPGSVVFRFLSTATAFLHVLVNYVNLTKMNLGRNFRSMFIEMLTTS